MKNPRTETVQIVDENNNEIAAVSRWIMREQQLIHRASYILVFNRAGELYVQKRTITKDVYPGYYDIAAGGVVLAGENYEESAERELAEELGIEDVALTHCFDHYFEDAANKVWGRIFRCRHEGPFTLQEEEIESGGFMDVQQVLDASGSKLFTPDGIEILRRLYPEGLNQF
ncbi:MAG TPA: NUDIX hydrolase YfcD [Desulfobacteraceae bacterium]|nr:NUDIX hydrolase YfcD [Desulfobacteraceae bacterium]